MKTINNLLSTGISPILLVILVLTIQIQLNRHLTSMNSAWIAPSSGEGIRLEPEIIKVLSFGNLPTAIDYLIILLLGDPNSAKVPKGSHASGYYYLDAVGELDPMFSELGVLANMLAIVRGDSLGARYLLERSQDFVKNHLPDYSEQFKNKYWPHPWQGQLFLAYVNIFELDDLPRGAKAFREAEAMKGAPFYINHLVTRLNEPGGEYEVGIKLLEFLIRGAKERGDAERGTKDERYLSTLETRLANLTINHFIYKTNQAFQKFLTTTKALSKHGNPTKTNTSALWQKFLKSSQTSLTDPWGGQLSLTETNKVVTTTPHERVFGLD